MHQAAMWLLTRFPLFILISVLTHLAVSFSQTLLHCKLAHRAAGNGFFRSHIAFHHRYYSKDHLVSEIYLDDEGNLTPFFLVPVFLAGVVSYFLLPLDLFIVQAFACSASFYAHVYFDREYHVDGSRLCRFAWFRRKQKLHFVHHRHADSNFAVIDFFWDRVFGTYREPELLQVRQSEQPPSG